jgi:hypothetical protein
MNLSPTVKVPLPKTQHFLRFTQDDNHINLIKVISTANII